MRAVLGLSGRLLVAHWPALVAWFLAGTLGRYIGIQLAGFVGGYSALGGLLLLPLAILAKCVSVVAMFLVLRDGMVRLRVIAPPPDDAAARRAAFRDALLSAILPFFAVYAALGFLREDVAAYLSRALAVQTGRQWDALAAGVTVDTSGAVDDLRLEPWTVAIVVLAFAGRWAWKRWQARLPRGSAVGAAYLEALWVFLVAYGVGELLGAVTAWVQSRQAIAWLTGLRAWLGDVFAPLGWAWDAVGWVIREAGAVVLVPLAWLTIAGVIYGQAVTPEGVRIRGALVERARTRFGRVPERLRRRLGDLGSDVGARFRPIWRAIVLMWRGGPLLIAGYLFAYAVLILGERWLGFGVTRLVGPHDLQTFWQAFAVPILLVVPLVVETLRTVLVAGAYDATIGALIGAPMVASGGKDESQVARELVREAELETERADDVGGDEERDPRGERPGFVAPA
ncbi:hypothetical protein [Microbacterium sp. 10M-3C3]|uniref:hypothetical protein n=1 Tax=Microbacterium sp. 10M-3C3 TaxID=2483401 RepID=UPI001F0CA82C|nr:hypothetical protein [Microbacterium sp. 10M-3C3]